LLWYEAWSWLLIFKLEEEENPALLLHLLQVFVETAVFGFASGFCCSLVVGFAQGSLEASVLYSTPDTGCLLVGTFSTSAR
jgi:hypothetical protein